MSDNISELQQELNELLNQLEIISDSFNKIRDGISDDNIGVGSRVRIKFEEGNEIEGRVWSVKRDGTCAVNRDGYASIINMNPDKLTNLSVGTYGKLDREQWKLQDRINVLKRTIAEQMNQKVDAIILSLKNGIPSEDAKNIIKTSTFQKWYKNNNLETVIALANLHSSHDIFICSVAREYIVQSSPETIYNTFVVNSLLT